MRHLCGAWKISTKNLWCQLWLPCCCSFLTENWYSSSFNFVSHKRQGKFRYFSVTHNWETSAKVSQHSVLRIVRHILAVRDTRAHGINLIYGAIISSVSLSLSLFTFFFFSETEISFSTAGVKAWSSENLLPFSRNYISLFGRKYLI